MSEPRKTRIQAIYEGVNLSEQIAGDLESFTYTDVASGESDRIEIRLNDASQKWMGTWMPQKGDRIHAEIDFYNWFLDDTYDRLLCGDFEVDDLSFSGRPFTCSIGAVSVPQDSAFRTQTRTKTWENATVQAIGEEIAQRAGISLYYDAQPIQIAGVEQNETDSSFLYGLCQDYGLAMKVFANKIIIFDEEKYEKNQALATLYEKDMVSWSYNTTVAGTYTGAVFSFSDPDNDEEYTVNIGGGDRIYEINVTADNLADAEKKAVAMLNNENKKSVTMSITMKANPGLYAGACVELSGFAGLDAKYYIEEIKTGVSGGGATQMKLSLRKVLERIKLTQEAGETEGELYEVKSGDTLWMIAQEKLKNAQRYTEIYSLNSAVIEEAAKAHGKSSSENGWWIYPGTQLVLPAE